jgi:glucose/arabinose dehydrogenase
LAQQLNSLAGKILRLNDDGTVPPTTRLWDALTCGRRFGRTAAAIRRASTFNPAPTICLRRSTVRAAFDGPGGGDEVNIIDKGKNYGWPTIHHRATQAGMESPLLEYTPACAPASGTFYRGSQFPQFKGNFFFGCLVGTRIIRVTLDGRRVVSQENLLEKQYGRIRDIAEGPDGYIYFLDLEPRRPRHSGE